MLRFPLIVAVIFLHSYGTKLTFSEGAVGSTANSALSDFIRNLLSQGIGRTAVPLFFLMSGYLFFKDFAPSLQNYIKKLRSRFRTLLIPFLFWNITMLAFLGLTQSMPLTAQYFSGTKATVADFSFIEGINAVMGIGQMPISYQMWFIRDLMVLVLLTPVIYFIDKYAGLPTLLALALAWYSGQFSSISRPLEATLFFFAGCHLVRRNLSLFSWDRYGPAIIGLYSVAAAVDALTFGTAVGNYVHKPAVVLGVMSALYLSKAAYRSTVVREKLSYLAGASFFVYAAHEPLLTVFRKVAFKIFHPSSSFSVIILYLAIPLLLIGFLLIIYSTLSRHAPNALRVVNGGR